MTRRQRFMAGVAAVAVAATLQAPARAQQDQAAEVLANTRQAIGGRKLEGLKTFSVQARILRNMGNMQVTTDSEFLLELPDKYLRSDTMSGGPMSMSSTAGFNGSTSLARFTAPGMAGGGVIRMMGPGGTVVGGNEKLTPEQQEQMNAGAVRNARNEVSRLMLGWFGMAHPTLGAEYTYAGEAESPDGRAHVIDVKGADGFAARLFIDQDTHLPLMVTYQGPQMRVMTSMQRAGGAPGGAQARQAGQMTEEERARLREEVERMRSQPPEMVEYSLFFGDWRDADGIRFPHAVQRATAGNTDEEWTFSKVKLNPKVDARKFQPEKTN